MKKMAQEAQGGIMQDLSGMGASRRGRRKSSLEAKIGLKFEAWAVCAGLKGCVRVEGGVCAMVRVVVLVVEIR